MENGRVEATGRWRERLAQWRTTYETALHSVGRLHHSVMDEGDNCVDPRGVLWFRWTPSRDDLADQLELLSLMAMLCDSDRGEFESLLSHFEDDYTQHFITHRTQYEAAYTMGVYVLIHDDEMLAAVETALLARDEKVSESYGEVRDQLVRQECGGIRQVPFFLEFESRSVNLNHAVASTLALVEQLNRRPREDHREWIGSAFHVATLQLNVYGGQQLDIHGTAQLALLLEAGIRLPLFQIGASFNQMTMSNLTMETVYTLQALLGVRCISTATRDCSRLEHLEVVTPLPAVSVCTAIAQSKTLQCVKIDRSMVRVAEEHSPMDRCCRWLAYALFSRDATHTIKMLELTTDVFGDFSADLIRDVLALDDPLLALIDPRAQIVGSPWKAPKNARVDVPKGTQISLVDGWMRDRQVVASVATPHALTALRVLEEGVDNGYVSFVLPGWGECLVPRDIVAVQHVEADVPRPRGIPHLRLDYIGADDIDAVNDLLRVVGQDVRRLDLHEIDYEFADAMQDVATHIVSFIRRCPRLEMLDLFAIQLETMQPLIDAFHDGSCSIQRLKFRQLRVVDMGSMHAFFDTLADPTHPMTACLREISFHVFEETIQDPARGSILNSCTDMMQKNTTLRVCRAITLSKKRCSQWSCRFRAFDGTPLPARKGPLALRSKLAFLSVVAPPPLSRRRVDSCALHGLDTNVVQTIFEFAAENEVRQSVVEVAVRKW